jgi:hypothetical protein
LGKSFFGKESHGNRPGVWPYLARRFDDAGDILVAESVDHPAASQSSG